MLPVITADEKRRELATVKENVLNEVCFRVDKELRGTLVFPYSIKDEFVCHNLHQVRDNVKAWLKDAGYAIVIETIQQRDSSNFDRQNIETRLTIDIPIVNREDNKE